jgi:hypothetical protein
MVSLPTEKTLLVIDPAHEMATRRVMTIPAGRPRSDVAAVTATALFALSLSHGSRM